jgi:hypothetical protein
MNHSTRPAWLIALAVLLLTIACQATPPNLPSAAQPTATVEAAAASVVSTATPPPPAPEPTATAQPTATTAAAVEPKTSAPIPAGWQVFTHKQIEGFVFPGDPQVWRQTVLYDQPTAFLKHASIDGCAISAVPGRGIGPPDRITRWQLGRLYWYVYDYTSNALVSIERPGALFLQLEGIQDKACLAAVQAFLAQVLTADEYKGATAYDPLPTPTLRPVPEGFTCPNTPPVRLRSGDYVHLVTNDLWLRAEARPDAAKIKTYSEGEPYSMMVKDGPVCTSKYVYWQVEISEMGEGAPEPVTGWFAEGDMKEYYLAPGY